MAGRRTSPRRWERLAASVAVVLVIALTAPTAAVAATSPSLQLSGVIHTSPFAGTSTSMQDGEGSAYVARDDSLWLLDDNGAQAFEVNRATGALKKVISSSEFRAAPRLGGGGTAGSNRAGDLESMAYDQAHDLLYAFSGKCCSSSELPTAFRLTRGSDNKFHVESYQPLPAGSDFTAAGLRQSDGKLYVGVGSDLRQYTYATNVVGSTFQVSGLSGILGMSFSDDSADLYVVTASQKLFKVNWTTMTIVSGWVFDLTPFGVRDSRAVERVGNQFYVLDGYDKRSSGDPLRHAVFVLTVGGGGDTTPPDTIINSGPSGTVSSTSATFTFSATESGSTFQCRLDGAAFAACTSPKSYTNLTNASHTFEVRATDAANNLDPTPAARTWTVTERPPVANAQSVSLNEDTTSTVTLTGTDPDNDPLRFKVTSLPTSGKLYDGTGTAGHLIVAGDLPYALTGAGNAVTYQPNAGYFGPDGFQFKANDGQLDSTSAATVSITVSHVNHAPVANNDSATTPPVTPVTVNVLANDSDPDNDPLTVSAVSTPSHGTAVVNADNTVMYVPDVGYAGPDSFDYSVSDGNGGTASATVSIVVGNPPVADAQSVSLNEDTTSTVTLTGTDPDNDPLRFKVTSLPTSGRLYDGTGTAGHLIVAGDLPYALTGAGNAVTYQPNAGYFGPDGFQFKANDGQLDSTSAATVSISVNHVNHAPVANNDSATTAPATAVTVNVVANDSDPDNDPLTVTGASVPAHGTAAVNPDNTVTYTPATGYSGPDSFTYTIDDGKGGTASATVAITVSSANPNLIGNPGFEVDTSGWEAGAAFNTLSRVAGGHAGGWASQLSNTSAGAQCTLDDKPSWVGVTQAGAYTLSIWARSDTPGLTFKLRIREYKSGAQQGSLSTTVTLTSSWQQVTVVYTPVTPGQSNLDYQAFTVNSPVGVCFQADDASITH